MKKILIYSFLTIGLIGLVGAGTASAKGWLGFGGDYEAMFQEKADFLGMSIDEVKDAWAEGKSFREMAIEQGITEEQFREFIRGLREGRLELHLQAMVDDGVITQEQADERLESIQEKIKNKEFRKSFHRGFGKCFR